MRKRHKYWTATTSNLRLYASRYIDTNVYNGLIYDNILRKLQPQADVLIRSPMEESAHHPAQNCPSLTCYRCVRTAPRRHRSERGRSPSAVRILAMGQCTAAWVRFGIRSVHPCAGYGLVFLPCSGMQSRQGGRVHCGMLCTQEPSLPLRDEVRSLRQTRGKQLLSLSMTKDETAPPSHWLVATAGAGKRLTVMLPQFKSISMRPARAGDPALRLPARLSRS
jgi:hypothetical protein